VKRRATHPVASNQLHRYTKAAVSPVLAQFREKGCKLQNDPSLSFLRRPYSRFQGRWLRMPRKGRPTVNIMWDLKGGRDAPISWSRTSRERNRSSGAVPFRWSGAVPRDSECTWAHARPENWDLRSEPCTSGARQVATLNYAFSRTAPVRRLA
jgi:hypothetical protein